MQRTACHLIALLLLVFGGSLFAASAVPSATVAVPSTTLIGDSLALTASFDNTSGVQTGYGPYVDLFLPATGNDGNSGVADDGKRRPS